MKSIALAVSVLAALVLTPAAGAVDNGIPDGDRHANVGMLGFDDADGDSPASFWCSGSVLSTGCSSPPRTASTPWPTTTCSGSPRSHRAPRRTRCTCPASSSKASPTRSPRPFTARSRRSCTLGSSPRPSRTTSRSSSSHAGRSTCGRSPAAPATARSCRSLHPTAAPRSLHARRLRRRPGLQRTRAALLRARLPPDRNRAVRGPDTRATAPARRRRQRRRRAVPRRLRVTAVPASDERRGLATVRRRRHVPPDRRAAPRHAIGTAFSRALRETALSTPARPTRSGSLWHHHRGVKIVVIGGHGLVGSKLVGALGDLGHDAVPASRRTGVDAVSEEGLAAALDGADAVIDGVQLGRLRGRRRDGVLPDDDREPPRRRAGSRREASRRTCRSSAAIASMTAATCAPRSRRRS